MRIEEGRGVRLAVTDRRGGVSVAPFDRNNLASHVGDNPESVRANRAALAESLGVAADRLVVLQAISGGDVAVVDATSPSEYEGVEGLVTTTSGVALAAIAADCVPVAMHDPVAGVLGMAHAGRRGMAARIVVRTLAQMQRCGADPARVDAWLGPAICGACYEVGEAVQAEVAPLVPEAVCDTRDGTPGVDLHAGVLAQLHSAGVRTITADARCTREHAELYSYRRDGRTGRHGVAAVMVAPAESAPRKP